MATPRSVLVRCSLLLGMTLAAASCSPGPESLESTTGSLSEAQCNAFQSDGKVTICHATASTTNPVVKLEVALAACLHGHARHPGDRVAVDDDCGANACLAEGAPCDATLRCCGGACTAGVCPASDLCDGVTCPAPDQCHDAGVCDPDSGLCSNPAKVNGSPCDDGNGCTSIDRCQGGSCVGSGNACPVCGDGTCAPLVEDNCNCPSDCPPVCGNGTCDCQESAATCPADCGSPPAVCGDGSCEPVVEDCGNCPGDCPCWMPGTTCVGGQCHTYCGNGTCEPFVEDNCNCPGDCPPVCGNGTCDCEETCGSCPSECGACVVCGDGSCDFPEDGCSCSTDCGPCAP